MMSAGGEGLTGLAQLDMPAKHISDWMLLDELSNTLRARQVRLGVLNQKSAWQDEISREEQSGLPIVIGNMRGVMSRGRDHIDQAVAKINLAGTVWPVSDS